MENVISHADVGSLAEVVQERETFVSEQTRKIMSLFRSALVYEREKIHLGNPSREEEIQFAERARQMISAAKAIINLASKKDAEQLEWVISRLNLSIGILENPMSKEEADDFLAKHFPG